MSNGDRCGICGCLIKGLFRDHSFEECRKETCKQAYAQGFSDARALAFSLCEIQEKIHHQYADSYEEGLRDMADLLYRAVYTLQPSEKL